MRKMLLLSCVVVNRFSTLPLIPFQNPKAEIFVAARTGDSLGGAATYVETFPTTFPRGTLSYELRRCPDDQRRFPYDGYGVWGYTMYPTPAAGLSNGGRMSIQHAKVPGDTSWAIGDGRWSSSSTFTPAPPVIEIMRNATFDVDALANSVFVNPANPMAPAPYWAAAAVWDPWIFIPQEPTDFHIVIHVSDIEVESWEPPGFECSAVLLAWGAFGTGEVPGEEPLAEWEYCAGVSGNDSTRADSLLIFDDVFHLSPGMTYWLTGNMTGEARGIRVEPTAVESATWGRVKVIWR